MAICSGGARVVGALAVRWERVAVLAEKAAVHGGEALTDGERQEMRAAFWEDPRRYSALVNKTWDDVKHRLSGSRKA